MTCTKWKDIKRKRLNGSVFDPAGVVIDDKSRSVIRRIAALKEKKGMYILTRFEECNHSTVDFSEDYDIIEGDMVEKKSSGKCPRCLRKQEIGKKEKIGKEGKSGHLDWRDK